MVLKFDEFMKNRNELIDQYAKGDITKDEFIELNYKYISSLDVSPFNKIDNIKKGIYNYQYYNLMAKYFQKIAHGINNDSSLRYENLDKANQFYIKKDYATLKILQILNFERVSAYYVKANSKKLDNKLFEIVLLDYEKMILHSKSFKIKELLVKNNVFKNEKQTSLVDVYINKKY